MKITLNNKPEEFAGKDQLTVTELLQLKNYTFKLLVVRINNKGVLKGDFDTTFVYEGDEVLVLHMISGG